MPYPFLILANSAKEPIYARKLINIYIYIYINIYIRTNFECPFYKCQIYINYSRRHFFLKSVIYRILRIFIHIYREMYTYIYTMYIYIYVYIYINIYTYMHVYAIMKIICSPGYHDNKFVANSCTWACTW